ncbi:MAG: hypothetical protein PHS46_07300 [Candidatus Omnitrophica bacterium]|nr:hypothetical protein [Candidatus Omnitrophota bacterium]
MEILPKFGRNKLITKIISLVVIQSFILSSISFAAITKDKSKAPKITPIAATADNVTVEKDFGIIKSRFAGNSNKLVINIQDAHCNYEAQTNIVNILEGLINHYDLKLVSVEGADGIIDTTWFKAFPDEEVRKEVATYFMKKGEITGPEFLSITKDYPISLFGAEDRKSYLENLNAFTSSYPLKAEVEKYYNSIKGALSRLKTLIYNDGLKAMDAKSQDYESKKIQFNEYIRFLQAEAEKEKINLRGYENFFRLVSVLIYEKKIDFNVTDKERSALIDELSRSISKDALTELVAKSIDFKAGKISSVEFYNHLKKLSNECDIDLSKKYVNLYNYIVYNSVYAKIDNEKLFNDIKLVENTIKEKLFQNDDQRTLDKLSRHIDILLGMVNIKLLNGDFNYYQTHREEFSHEAFTSFIQKKTTQYGLAYQVEPPTEAVAKSIPKLEDFYSIAIKRDKALVDNTLKEMSKEKQNVAVLVTGGFHSEGMSRLLEKEGVSYIVICPSITKDVPTPYIQILTNQRTPLEDILTSPEAKKSMLAPFSRVLYAPLDEEHLRELLYTATTHPRARDKIDAGLKSTIEGFIGEAQDVRRQMITRFIQQWLIDKLPFVAKHPYARDEAIMKEAYLKAMQAGLTDSGMDIKTADKVVKAISSLPEFDRIFTTIFNRVMPAAGVASYIRRSAVVVPGETLVSGNAAKSEILTAAGIFTENGQLNNSSFSSNNSNDYRIIRLKDGRYFILEVASGIAGYTDPVTGKMTQVSGGGTGVSQNITLAQAYSTPELFDSYIVQAVSGAAKIIPELPKLIADYNSWKKAEVAPLEKQLAALQQENTEDSRGKAKELKKQIDDMIKKRVAVIDDLLSEKYNSPMAEQFVGSLAGITSDSLVSDIPTLEEFRKSPDYSKYMAMAREMTLGSSIGELDVYGGAASRLFGEGQAADTSLSFAGHDIYQIAELQGMTLPDNAIKGLNVMTRIALQKWLDVEEELKRKYEGTGKAEEEIRKEREKIMAQKSWIIVVNDESGLPLLQEMVAHNHYGFDPERVVFVVQPTFHGYSYDENGRAVRIDSTRPTPPGHGSATMQALNEGRAFWVDKNGRIHNINEDAETYLHKKTGVRLWVQGRVNDILKLGYTKSQHPELALHEVDMGILALTLSQMEDVDTLSHGKNAVLEQVGSDPRIKGAAPIQAGGRQFLVEKVAMSAQVRKVAIGEGKPQNRFFNFYKRLALREVKRQGLPVYLRFRDGYLYAETVTGDITMLKGMNAGWAMETTRQLTDYKDLATLENGVGGALKQDSDPVFRKYAIAEAKRSRDSVNITGLELAAGLNNNTPAGAVKNDGFMTGQMMEHEQVYVEGRAIPAGDSKSAVMGSMENLMGITHEQASSLHERLSRELYPNSRALLTGGSIILVNSRLIWIAAYGDSEDRKTAILDLSAGAVLDRNVYTDHISLSAGSFRFEAAGPILTIKTSGVVLTTVNIDDLAAASSADQKLGTINLRDVLNNPSDTYEIPMTQLIEQYGANIKWAIDRMQKSTAGTRGIIDKDDVLGGPQLNAAVVAFMAQGYADYIKNNFPAEQQAVFIGFDPRYFSREFAQIITRVFLANGIIVYRDENEAYSQTPVTSYMAYHFKLACGIEITSSHNPPNQNGIKSMTWYGGVDTDDVSAKIASYIQKRYEDGLKGKGTLKIAAYDTSTIRTVPAKKIYYENYMSRLFDANTVTTMKQAMDNGARFIFDGLYGVAGSSMEYYLNRIFTDYDWRGKIIVMNGTPDSAIGGIARPDPSNPKTLELSGVLEKLASTPGVLIAATADMDADRIGTSVIIPDKDVERAKRCGLFVSQMRFAGNTVNIVRFTPNQIFTLIAYERVLQAYERKIGTRGFDAIQKAIAEGRAPELYLLTSIPSSLIAKQMMEKFGGKVILTTVGYKNLGYEAERIERENPNAIVVALTEESGGGQIAPFMRDTRGRGVHKDKDTIVLALALFSQASRLYNDGNKNLLDLYSDMAEKLGGLFYYERIDAYLPNQQMAESLSLEDQQTAEGIKADFVRHYRAIDHVTEPGAVKSNLDDPKNISTLASLFGKSAKNIVSVQEVPVVNTILLVGEGDNWQHIQPVAKRFVFEDGEVIEVFHTGRNDQEGPSIAIYNPDGTLKARTLLRASGTESLIRIYLEIFEPQANPNPGNLVTYFRPLLEYLGLQNYSLKSGGENYLSEYASSVSKKYDIAQPAKSPEIPQRPAAIVAATFDQPIVAQEKVIPTGSAPAGSNSVVTTIDDTTPDVEIAKALAPLTTDTIDQIPSWVPGNFPLSAYIEASRATLSETVRSVATRQGVGVNSDVAAIVAIDTDIGDRGARDIAQAVENRLRDMQIGDDAVVIVRASGAGLVEAINKERTRLTALGKRVAVVINTNTSVNSAVEEQLNVIVRETNTGLTDQNGQPVGQSALLKMDNRDKRAFSVLGLIDVDMRIAFNQGDENILRGLNSIAVNARTGQHFTSSDLAGILCGQLHLKPMTPVDVNNIDDLQRGEKAAGHSL